MKTSAKILSILLIIIMFGSNIPTSFLNMPQKSHDNGIQQAFALTTPLDIHKIKDYSLFALQSITIDRSVIIDGGNVGANSTSGNSPQIIVGAQSNFMDPASAVVANNIKISNGATVQNIFYNQLVNRGTILGTQTTPLQFPILQSLPSFPPSTPGSTSIDVPKGSFMNLGPGQYGTITVGDSAILNFTGGTYNIISLNAGTDSKLFFSSTSQIVIQNQFTLGTRAELRSITSQIHAHNILIFVGDGSITSRSSTTILFGRDSIVNANVFAPNADIKMSNGTKATGAFIANNIKISSNSEIAYDPVFGVASDLFLQYENIATELGKISDVSDESVVTDYLNKTITSLRANTTSLVSDPNARSTLLSTLNTALQNVNNAGYAVLALNDATANTSLNQARTYIGNYITEIESLNGTTISTSTANILFFEANKTSTGSLKSGTSIVDIIVNNPLVITNQIIDKAKTDGTILQSTVNSLNDLGFAVTINAQHHSPTAVDISFLNSVTAQLFDFSISNSILSMFLTEGFLEEVLHTNNDLTTEQFATVMTASPMMVANALSSSDVSASLKFALVTACQPSFSFDECLSSFANPNSSTSAFFISVEGGTIASTIVGIAIQTCLETPECEAILDAIIHEAVLQGGESLNTAIFTTVTVPGLKFNDLNGNGVQDSGETVLSGWQFQLFPVFENEELGNPAQTATSDANGNFEFDNVQIPKSAPQIAVIETLQGGWVSSTGTTKEISVTPDSSNHFTAPLQTFGNRVQQVFLNDHFDSDPNGWQFLGDSGYILTLDTTTGQPAPSARITGDTFLGICSNHGMAKSIDISAYTGGPLTLAFDWRASSTSGIDTTQAFLKVTNANTGATLFTHTLIAPSSILDTGWQFYSTDISSYVSGVSNIQVYLYLEDCWLSYWNINNWYDNISLFTGTTPPSSLVLNTQLSPSTPLGAPYFYPEVNQTSANVTRPGSITIPLSVEWEQGYAPQPVGITLGNLTNTNMTYSITSIRNTTSYQLFNIALNVPSSVQPNQYLIPAYVNEIGTNHTKAQVFSIGVQ